MSEVKVHRYDVNLCPDRQCDCGASFATEECPDSNGDYVRYVDHEKELAALREELAGANRSAETLHEVIGRLKSERDAADQRNVTRDIESAAKVLASCMDYPWEHMPENGRTLMRKHAKDVVDAALAQPTESGASE